MNEGHVYASSPDNTRLWRYDFRHGRALVYASEVTVADLNQDRELELIFTTFGDPENITPGVAHGYLMVLDRTGSVLADIELPRLGTNGNGSGAPAAPTIGDGDLEIVVQTSSGDMFIYSVPGSNTL